MTSRRSPNSSPKRLGAGYRGLGRTTSLKCCWVRRKHQLREVLNRILLVTPRQSMISCGDGSAGYAA
jgi:hypothetical protein